MQGCMLLSAYLNVDKLLISQKDENMQEPIAPFKTTCNLGTLHIENGSIFITAPFNKLVWSMPISSIIAITSNIGFMTGEITVYTPQGERKIETLQKKKAVEILNLLNRPQTIPLDMEIQRTKFALEQCKLSLREVNLNMSNQRAHYQQSHVNGLIGDFQRGSKNAHLRKDQPVKEQLQQRKLVLEKHLSQLQFQKAQGATTISPLAL